MKYGITIRDCNWRKIEIESDVPLTEDELDQIYSMGEEGVPDRFTVTEGEEGGFYPDKVDLVEMK